MVLDPTLTGRPPMLAHRVSGLPAPILTAVLVDESGTYVDASGSAAPDEAEYDTAGVAFGSIGATFASLLANGSSAAIRILRCFNATDGWIELSLDGSTAHVEVAPYSGFSDDLRGNLLKETSGVEVRYLSGYQPTTGRASVSVVWVTP